MEPGFGGGGGVPASGQMAPPSMLPANPGALEPMPSKLTGPALCMDPGQGCQDLYLSMRLSIITVALRSLSCAGMGQGWGPGSHNAQMHGVTQPNTMVPVGASPLSPDPGSSAGSARPGR